MKTFRIYLKSGASFIIKARRFDPVGLQFYTSANKLDTTFYLNTSELAAVIPEESTED